jgi:hypothetical protein
MRLWWGQREEQRAPLTSVSVDEPHDGPGRSLHAEAVSSQRKRRCLIVGGFAFAIVILVAIFVGEERTENGGRDDRRASRRSSSLLLCRSLFLPCIILPARGRRVWVDRACGRVL